MQRCTMKLNFKAARSTVMGRFFRQQRMDSINPNVSRTTRAYWVGFRVFWEVV
jgi:hypothetical protein